MFSPGARVAGAYVACFVLWGSTWLMIRLGLRDLPPLTFAGARMALAAALLTPLALRHGLRSLPGSRWALVGAVGLLQIGLAYALLFAAQQWVPSGLAAVLFATFPVWIVLSARVLLPGHRLTARQIVACVLGVAGVALLQLRALGEQAVPVNATLGGLLIVAAAIIVAVANICARRWLHEVPAVLTTWGQVGSGAIFLLLLAVALERGATPLWTPRAIGVLVYLAVFGTVLPYLALFWLLPRVPMAAIGAIPLLDTTVAVALGAIVLAEPVGWNFAAGGVMVMGAAAVANLEGR